MYFLRAFLANFWSISWRFLVHLIIRALITVRIIRVESVKYFANDFSVRNVFRDFRSTGELSTWNVEVYFLPTKICLTVDYFNNVLSSKSLKGWKKNFELLMKTHRARSRSFRWRILRGPRNWSVSSTFLFLSVWPTPGCPRPAGENTSWLVFR